MFTTKPAARVIVSLWPYFWQGPASTLIHKNCVRLRHLAYSWGKWGTTGSAGNCQFRVLGPLSCRRAILTYVTESGTWAEELQMHTGVDKLYLAIWFRLMWCRKPWVMSRRPPGLLSACSSASCKTSIVTFAQINSHIKNKNMYH